MPQSMVKFVFEASVPMVEVEATLRLALLAVETLHGEDRVRMEAWASVNLASRTCMIDTTSEVGRTLAVVFGGFIRREFGDDAVRVEQLCRPAKGMELCA